MTVNMIVPVEATQVAPATTPHDVWVKYIITEWRENLLHLSICSYMYYAM